MAKLDFEASKELRALFNEEYEQWRTKHRAGLEELARRCGLSASYIGQIGRYGRIPSRSALILLALNFEIDPPERIFRAANIHEPWPLGRDTVLRPRSETDHGFLNIRLDMEGLANTVREIIRTEIRPRNVRDLSRGQPLRIGYNSLIDWTFKTPGNRSDKPQGFFPEVCEMLAIALQCEFQGRFVSYAEYPTLMARGELDIFGPIYAAPTLPHGVHFTNSLFKTGMSVLARKRKTNELPSLPLPKKVSDLVKHDYEIAVLKYGRAHLLANTLLKRPDDRLILCSSHEEAMDRVLLKGISRPAHLFLVNAVTAYRVHQEHKAELDLVFGKSGELIDRSEAAIAVRPDWPELVPRINECLTFLQQTGALREHFDNWFPSELTGLVEPPPHSRV